ncbi:ankyrin repeat domain-containing protein [Candidatus Berkiella cookevillensis]|uniref:Ankyrin repeat domain-containing protein n=1 Tax=Candidatus Berkiella cookevillensis TaxID=437022 RepID=A0A0Q9YBR0_9GAMM|nr:ankyrin repeat domain-containing protein [Candidatus Berkiella cookevillensis]MCS5707732.1 ankyrin repeat domain-containing protein [Candidatus Berkiella cookevillensis]
MLNSLIKIIQNTQIDEETALAQINLLLSKNPIDLDVPSLKAITTPLIEAAKRGFTKLVAYLSAQGLPINEVSQNGHTALTAAIFAEKIDTALYLISHTQQLIPSLQGHTTLHDVVEKGQISLISPLLTIHPELLNQETDEGETALFLAAKQGNLAAIQVLCAQGANPIQSNAHGISPTAIAFIEGHIETLAFLMNECHTSPLASDSIANQHHILDQMVVNKRNLQKIKCLKLFIAAGAGLSVDFLSDAALSILKLKRSQLHDFLLLVKSVDAHNAITERFITHRTQLENTLKSSPQFLDIQKLVNIAQHHLCIENNNIKKTQQLLLKYLPQISLSSDTSDLTVFAQTTEHHSHDKLPSKREMIYLHQDVLLPFLCDGLNRLDRLSNTLERKLSFSCETLCKANQSDNGIEKTLTYWLNTLQDLIYAAHNPATREITFNKKLIYDIVHDEFDAIYNKFLLLFQITKNDGTITKHAALIDQKLRQILKENSAALIYSNVGFYNSLWDAQALVTIKLAHWHLNEGKYNEALALSLESLEFNEKMLINNPYLQISANHTKGLCLSTAAYVFIRHGWTSKATHQLQEAIALQTVCNLHDPLLSESCLLLADVFIEQKKPEKYTKIITILESTHQYLSKLEKIASKDKQASIQIEKNKLKDKISQLKKLYIQNKIALMREMLSLFGTISQQSNEVIFQYKPYILHDSNKHLFDIFIKKNAFITRRNKRKIVFNNNCLFNADFLETLTELKNILAIANIVTEKASIKDTEHKLVDLLHDKLQGLTLSASLDELVTESDDIKHTSDQICASSIQEEIQSSTLDSNIKDETTLYTLSNSSRQEDEIVLDTPEVITPHSVVSSTHAYSKAQTHEAENFGFTPLPGFTPIVAISSNRLAKHSLFMTMPEDSRVFAPFYKLIRNESSTDYYDIPAISAKGHNKQGIKVGTMLVQHPKKRAEKIAYGRLKILGKSIGTLRAHGFVEQTITLPNNKQRKLFVFREENVTDKKAEQRSNYKF